MTPDIYAGKHTLARSTLQGIDGNDTLNRQGIGGEGGTGHGLELGELMISLRPDAHVPALDVTMKKFCRAHCLGEEIANLLRHHGYGSPSTFRHVEDRILRKNGFKDGHIAELKWALRRTVGKDLLVRSGKPELHEGKGGDGGNKGGGGGDGEGPGVPNTLHSWFANIWGGIGGQGGRGGADGTEGTNGTSVKNRTGQDLQYPQSPVTLWERFRRMLPSSWATTTGTYIFGTAPCIVSAIDSSKMKIGGVGGKGGSGSLRGGKGGEGKASRIPIGIVSTFAKIFGRAVSAERAALAAIAAVAAGLGGVQIRWKPTAKYMHKVTSVKLRRPQLGRTNAKKVNNAASKKGNHSLEHSACLEASSPELSKKVRRQNNTSVVDDDAKLFIHLQLAQGCNGFLDQILLLRQQLLPSDPPHCQILALVTEFTDMDIAKLTVEELQAADRLVGVMNEAANILCAFPRPRAFPTCAAIRAVHDRRHIEHNLGPKFRYPRLRHDMPSRRRNVGLIHSSIRKHRASSNLTAGWMQFPRRSISALACSMLSMIEIKNSIVFGWTLIIL
ncbi:hypothetical protein K438DRAFT_1782579 [Mycena galopus ATCC 62051]|nr:hypothetical protein K438DRAFT_1782579 [Mycena galopus ATCC 62051]